MEVESGPSNNKEVPQTLVRHSPNKIKNSEATGLYQLNMAVDQPNSKIDGFISKFVQSPVDNDHRFETRVWYKETNTPSVSQQLNEAAEQPNPKADDFLNKLVRINVQNYGQQHQRYPV